MLAKLTTFLKEARVELKKVAWPTRRDTIHYTVTVVIISAVVALFLGSLDFIFQFVLNTFIL